MALHVSRASARSGRRPCSVGRYQQMMQGPRSARRKRGGCAINAVDGGGRRRWLLLRRCGLWWTGADLRGWYVRKWTIFAIPRVVCRRGSIPSRSTCVVLRWAEAEVAAANARVDALEKMSKESRGDDLSAGVCASEDAGLVDAASGVFCDCGGKSRNDAEMATPLGAAVKFSMSMVWDGVKADDVGADAVMTDDPAVFGDYGDMVDVVSEGRSASVLQERDVVGGPEGSVEVRSAGRGIRGYRWCGFCRGCRAT